MSSAPQAVGPPPTTTGAIGWVRQNLLSNWYNALFTVIALALLLYLLKGAVGWVFFTADWDAATSNIKLFLVGQYPSEQLWRVNLSVLLVSLLAGLSWGVWGGIARNVGIALALAFGIPALWPVAIDSLGLDMRLWLIANPVIVAAGYWLARTTIGRPRWIIAAWMVSFFISLALLRGFGSNAWLPLVETDKWGGLLLTFILALVGIVASFPLGVLLALGRRSSLPVVSLFSTLFIELVRGVPLVSLLFMTQIIVPLLLPEGFLLDRVLRALVAITLFSAAYMAENVRGGLQAVPTGQIEAAKALGLNGVYVMLFIVLPQALRAVIPAIVGQFISLFKDTSLVAIVGLLDVVGIGKSIILGNVQWIGSQREVYVFIAAIFWVFTYSMSYASRKLETALGVGSR
ncbi:MAG: amino acid ABC transporter permease [Chloroflexi bacterium]|nr:amino acid ABC transporter permease [Chloroflexota bacterium]